MRSRERRWHSVATAKHFTLLLAGFVILVLGLVTTFQRRLVFPRHFAPLPSGHHFPAQSGLDPISEPGFERFWVPQAGGKAEDHSEVWVLKPLQGKPRGLVYYMHGNGETIDDMAVMLARYVQEGFVLVLPEYRGYGRSTGYPTATGILADYDEVAAAIDARSDFKDLPRIIHGRSLGGGFAAEFSLKHPPKIAIFESTFTTLKDRAADFGAPGFLLFDKLDVKTFIASFKGPLLIMHGTEDMIVPVKYGRALHALQPNSQYKEFPSGHNDMFYANGYWATLLSFLNDALR